MKILIITGGTSSERKISLISANAAKNALQENGHKTILFDFKKGYSSLKKVMHEFDLIFPIMHGKEGEDGMLYKFLHSTRKPFIGADPRGAQIAFDKIRFKKYADAKRLSTAEWIIVRNDDDIVKFGFPCVLKASHGGSSNEVVILSSIKDLTHAHAKKILKLRSRLYVERLISGIEITVGVVFDRALPVLEIIPPENGWFDYKNKYSGGTKEIPFAPSVRKSVQKKAQMIALNVHKDLRLGSYSRTDFIVKDHIPYILEANTPGGVGLTDESLFPKAAKAAGISFAQLLEKILESGKKF